MFRTSFFLAAIVVFGACARDARVEGEDSPAYVPRMVAVHSPYCSVCKEMKPLVDGLVSECDSKGVRVETVDVSKEENEKLIDEYRVEGLPTYLFIDEAGYEVARLVGAQTESTLKQALGVLRGEECPGLGRLPGKKT